MCPIPSSQEAIGSTTNNTTETNALSLIPQDHLSREAYTFASSRLQPEILAHSLRVYIYAKRLLQTREKSSPWGRDTHLPLLLVAALFHDMGAAPDYDDEPSRFEVEGADAAVSFLRQHQSLNPGGTEVGEPELKEIWSAIALHTSPGIAERFSPLARVMRQAPLADFGDADVRRKMGGVGLMSKEGEGEKVVREAEGLFPRGEVERVLSEAVVGQGVGRAEKAPPASWAGVMVKWREENPGWEGVNGAF